MPSKTVLRRLKAKAPAKNFTADQVGVLLKSATEPLRTMILLGLNCGFGNGDVGRLTWSVVDMKAGWIDFPRPKTGVARRCPLWPETLKALGDWRPQRPEPNDPQHADLVFVTRWGGSYAKDDGGTDNPVAKEFAKLLKRTGLVQKGRGFYGLRHTFATVSGQAADQVATDLVMGHVDPSIAATYRGAVWDERLQRVADFVHDWAFPKPKRKRASK